LEAVRLSPTYFEAHLFLARVLLGQGNKDQALEHLEAGLKGLPQQRELTPMFVDVAMAIAICRSRRTSQQHIGER
jgi:hypothetical protein